MPGRYAPRVRRSPDGRLMETIGTPRDMRAGYEVRSLSRQPRRYIQSPALSAVMTGGAQGWLGNQLTDMTLPATSTQTSSKVERAGSWGNRRTPVASDILQPLSLNVQSAARCGPMLVYTPRALIRSGSASVAHLATSSRDFNRECRIDRSLRRRLSSLPALRRQHFTYRLLGNSLVKTPCHEGGITVFSE